eukprot:3439405-Rhodomonas_salina.2
MISRCRYGCPELTWHALRQVRGLCKRLLEYDNVPNKQKTFVNFCKNSLALNRRYPVLTYAVALPGSLSLQRRCGKRWAVSCAICYARATRCPVLTQRICRAPTRFRYEARDLHPEQYVMSGTDAAYRFSPPRSVEEASSREQQVVCGEGGGGGEEAEGRRGGGGWGWGGEEEEEEEEEQGSTGRQTYTHTPCTHPHLFALQYGLARDLDPTATSLDCFVLQKRVRGVDLRGQQEEKEEEEEEESKEEKKEKKKKKKKEAADEHREVAPSYAVSGTGIASPCMSYRKSGLDIQTSVSEEEEEEDKDKKKKKEKEEEEEEEEEESEKKKKKKEKKEKKRKQKDVARRFPPTHCAALSGTDVAYASGRRTRRKRRLRR